MANSQDPGGGGENAATKGVKRQYRKECSLLVDVGDNQAVKAGYIIEAVNKHCGEGKLLACMPKSGNMYLITMSDKTVADYISDGLPFGDKILNCDPMKKDTMHVSIMNVDPFVDDSEIIDKLSSFGVKVIGQVRRMYYEGTDIENCNRVCKIKLPKDFVSLPYMMRLSDGESSSMYRVIHDHQRKTCHKCNSPLHLFKDCPEFICYRCSEQGHFKSQCKSIWCQTCYTWNCNSDHHNSDVQNDQEVDENFESDIETDTSVEFCENGCSMPKENCDCLCDVCRYNVKDCSCDTTTNQTETIELCEKTGEFIAVPERKNSESGETMFGDVFELNTYTQNPPDTKESPNEAATDNGKNFADVVRSTARPAERMEVDKTVIPKRPHASPDQDNNGAKGRASSQRRKKNKKK